MALKRHLDPGLLLTGLAAFIFSASFSFVNIIKYQNFSLTTFGWHCFYVYPKLFTIKHFSDLSPIYELPALVYLFVPVNYILALIYRLFLKPEALLSLQAVILASACLPLYLIAKKVLGSSYLAFALALAYLLHPVVSVGALLGFIPSALGLPLLMSAFYYLEKSRPVKFILFLMLAGLCKIDIVLMNLILGFILLFRTGWKKQGRIIIGISLAWVIVVSAACVIYLHTVAKPFPVNLLQVDGYADNLQGVARYVLFNPAMLLANIFNQENMLLVSFFYLPNIFCFFSLIWLLPIIPELLFILVRNQHSSGIFLILPFIFLGSIYGLARVFKSITGYYQQNKRFALILVNVSASLILVFTVIQHYYIPKQSYFSGNLGPLPFTREFKLRDCRITAHAQIGMSILKQVPPDSSCLASFFLAPQLAGIRQLERFDRFVLQRGYSYDYVLVDLSQPVLFQISPKEYYLRLKEFLTLGKYGVMVFEDGWLLLKSGYSQSRNNEVSAFIEGGRLNHDKNINH